MQFTGGAQPPPENWPCSNDSFQQLSGERVSIRQSVMKNLSANFACSSECISPHAKSTVTLAAAEVLEEEERKRETTTSWLSLEGDGCTTSGSRLVRCKVLQMIAHVRFRFTNRLPGRYSDHSRAVAGERWLRSHAALRWKSVRRRNRKLLARETTISR